MANQFLGIIMLRIEKKVAWFIEETQVTKDGNKVTQQYVKECFNMRKELCVIFMDVY